MGMSVYSECDPKQYFSVSTIRKSVMDEHGIKCTIKELQEKAKSSVPRAVIVTGSAKHEAKQRRVKIYAYADFKEENG